MISKFIRRIRYFLFHRRADRELQEEMASHREMMGERSASFGPALRLREEARDAWGLVWLEHAVQDVRYGVRSLRNAPAFALSAIAILALGIGLNLTLFELVNASILRPPAIRDPHSFVRFILNGRSERGRSNNGQFTVAAARYAASHAEVVRALLLQRNERVAWGAENENRQAGFVSWNWFFEAGYGAERGRVFRESDDTAGAAPVVVVNHFFWISQLGGDPEIVGKTVHVNERQATVIGVAPAEFPWDADVWIPIEQGGYFGVPVINTSVYARVQPGLTPSAIREATRAAITAAPKDNWQWKETWLDAQPATAHFQYPEEARKQWPIVGAVAGLTLLVLLIACANLSNLVLSRTMGRLREIGVCAALGASRGRVVRQLLTECFLLGCTGSAFGLALSYTAARGIASVALLPPYLNFAPDARVLLAAFGLAVAAMLAIGLIPAWRACRQDLVSVMKDGTQQASSGLQRARIRQALVAVQVAGSCLLLIVAGLMLQSLRSIAKNGPGFDVRNIATVEAPVYRYLRQPAEAKAYWEQVKALAANLPDLESMALVSLEPLGNQTMMADYDGLPGLTVVEQNVEPEYFALMHMPVLAGRTFERTDPDNARILSRRVAGILFGVDEAVGKRMFGSLQVVGVVEDAQISHLQNPAMTEIYRPLVPGFYSSAKLMVRARNDISVLLPQLRQVLRVPDQRMFGDARLMESNYEDKLRPIRLSSSIAAMVGILALVVACLGVFGAVSYSATLRTKEIGIRMALGASRADVLSILTWQVVWPATLGIIIGSMGAWRAAKLLTAEPLYLPPFHSTVLAVAVAILAGSAILAAVLPALRALRGDPLEALRYE